jgi:hypothetical protein
VIQVIKSGEYEECGSWRATKVVMETKTLVDEALVESIEVCYIAREAVRDVYKMANMTHTFEYCYDGPMSVAIYEQMDIQYVFRKNHVDHKVMIIQSHYNGVIYFT